MKIGFFGDSFCAVEKKEPNEYETYIHKLKKHYNAEIVNLGIPGSSIYDVILLQFKQFYAGNNVPDVCIFTWTHYSRLFNRTKRNITPNNAVDAHKDYYKHIFHINIHISSTIVFVFSWLYLGIAKDFFVPIFIFIHIPLLVPGIGELL